MTKKLQHLFALSEKGAKDLVKAVFWCFVCNLSLMLPVGAVLFTAQHLLDSMENGGNPVEGFWICTGFAAAVSASVICPSLVPVCFAVSGNL